MSIRPAPLPEWEDEDTLPSSRAPFDCAPISDLPQTPFGRIAAVTRLRDKGILTSNDAIALLNFPDVCSPVQKLSRWQRLIGWIVLWSCRIRYRLALIFHRLAGWLSP